MKAKTKKRIQGSVSVLLIIILLPMMTLSALIVDSSRINMARSMVSSAGDLAMNSALADYDTILNDVYGLFAISQSDEELESSIKEYFETTLVSYGVVSEDDADDYVTALMGDFQGFVANATSDTDVTATINNFLDMGISDVKVEKIESASLANPDVLRTQIVDYMKYRAPLNMGLSFFDSIKAFSTVEEQTEVVEKQVEAQESTQDVTSACKNLITAIREYDKLIDEMNSASSDKAVKGKSSSTDGVLVPVSEYHTQIDKYRTDWGDHYSQINKLAMVFFGKSPDVSTLYLYGLRNANATALQQPFTEYVTTSGYTVNTANSGIAVEVTLQDTKEGAKSDFETQAAALGNYQSIANTYENQNYLPQDVLNSERTAFTDENTAMTEFVKFEEFLKDQSTAVTYSQVKTILEELSKVAAYYNKYIELLDGEISEAETALNAAETAKNNALSSVSAFESYFTNLQSKVNSMKDLYSTDDANDTGIYCNTILSGITNTDGEDLSAVVGTMLSSFQLPSQVTVGDRAFYNLSSTTLNMYKENTYDADYRFLKVMKEIANSSLKDGTSSLADAATYQAICTKTSEYFTKLASGEITSSYTTYMGQKLTAAQRGNVLYQLLAALYQCNEYVKSAASGITSYNTVIYGNDTTEGYQSLCDTYDACSQTLSDLQSEKSQATTRYGSCITPYCTFTSQYQYDLYYYEKFQTAAKNAINKSVSAIYTQYSKIESNLETITSKLEDISNKAHSVVTAIEAYQAKVEAWSDANENYASNNSADSFSKQNDIDIEATKEQYNLESAQKLETYVIGVWDAFDNLLSYMNGTNANYQNSSCLQYAGKALSEYQNADQVVNQIQTYSDVGYSIEDSLPDIIRPDDELNRVFSWLYPESDAPAVEFSNPTEFDVPFQMQFLKPTVVQIAFLSYLNATFPDESTMSDEDIVANEAEENDYNDAKDTLLTQKNGETSTASTDGDSGSGESGESGSTESSSGSTGYGYTYDDDSKQNLGSNGDLPSALARETVVADATYQISEDEDGNLNASESLSSQQSVLSTILHGIGEVAETGLENVYILDYIFENFSYNTIVQDMVADGEQNNATDSEITQYAKMNDLLSNQEILNNYKEKATMLSNYKINENNNYLYGAEIEYILYGNKNDPEKNVTYAKTSIYAIRFAFNCIYAFTNSEIRNSTRAAGMAVQAATFGVVPYQVVQIVLQLALAAGESAIDLDMMNKGIEVAVVKSKDTWVLGSSGLTNSVKEIVTDHVEHAVEEAITTTIEGIASGIQALTDATADELEGALNSLTEDMKKTIDEKAKDILDTAFSHMQTSVESILDGLKFDEKEEGADSYTIENAKSFVYEKFDELSQNISGELYGMFGDNEIAIAVVDNLVPNIEGLLSEIETYIIGQLDVVSTAEGDVKTAVNQQIDDIKIGLIEEIDIQKAAFDNTVSAITAEFKSEFDNQVSEYKNQITEAAGELTEEAAKELKGEIQSVTNEFMGEYLNDNGVSSTIGSGLSDIASGENLSSESSSFASNIKFGYKDYLMLFTFVAICVDDDDILCRMADVIQLNLQNAGSDADYTHSKGSEFLMKNANTYVSVTATAKLELLFLNLDIFKSNLGATDTELEEQFNTVAEINYKGLYGY